MADHPSDRPSEDTSETVGLPKDLRVRRRYTLSPAALEQRRLAAQQPKPGMKGVRNRWKHGMYAQSFLTRLKPCKSSCDQYPCEYVSEGQTQAGGDCLDIAEMLHVVRAVQDAINDPKTAEDFKEIAALNIANSIKVLEMLQEDVLRDGSLVKSEKMTAHGLQTEYKDHPALLALPKMIQHLGMTPEQFMMTPKALARKESEDEAVKTLTDMLASTGKSLKRAREKSAEKDDS